MKKELKQILLICLFLIIGCVLGYFVALNQMNQLSDPEYIAFWTSQNMSVPEPLGFTRSILSFGLLFAGIPTGLIFYSGLVKKWLTPIAPKIIIGFVTFPIYTLKDNNILVVKSDHINPNEFFMDLPAIKKSGITIIPLIEEKVEEIIDSLYRSDKRELKIIHLGYSITCKATYIDGYIAPDLKIQDVEVHITKEMVLMDIGMISGILIIAVLVAGITIMKKRPKQILSEMS